MLLFILCGWYGSWCDYVVLCTFDVAVMFLCCVSIDFMLIGVCGFLFFFFFFFTQKTAYEMRISDWSSDVCSSDLARRPECRRCAGRSRRQSGETEPLGEDQPRPAGGRDPPCALCRIRQNAGRGRGVPLQSETENRGDARCDDEDIASGRSGAAPCRRQRRARIAQQVGERTKIGRAHV